MTKQKRSKKEEDKSVEEKTTLHGKTVNVWHNYYHYFVSFIFVVFW